MKDSDWEILYKLYKTPNITKVANMLYITQPSLTKRLKSIEDEFEIKVVYRTPKGVEFTPEGEYLAKQAQKYINFINETRKELKTYKTNAEEIITIGSSYTFSKYQLTEILFNYSESHPNVKFEISNDQSNVNFRKVVDRTVDIGFVRGDYEGPIKKILIGEDEGYILSKEPVDINDLSKIQRIIYKTNEKTIELVDNWWRQYYQSKPSKVMNAGYVDFAWQLVDKGFGYTCCFLSKSFKNEYNLNITPMLNKDGSRVIRKTLFIYSETRKTSGYLQEFIDYIEEELKIKK